MDNLRTGIAAALAVTLLSALAPAQETLQQAVANRLVTVVGDPLRGDPQGVTSVQYSPDGKRVLTAGGAGDLQLWSASSGRLEKQVRAHAGFVHFASFFDGGAQIVSVGTDRTVGIFDARSGAERGRIGELPEKFGRQLEYHSWHVTADGKYLLMRDPTYQATGLLRVDLEQGALVEPLALPGGSLSRFCMSPDGRFLALVERDEQFVNYLHLYDVTEQKTVAREQAPYANAMLFSADGGKLFALGVDTWQVWNGRTGALEAELDGLVDTPRGVAASPDGRRLYVGSSVQGKLVGADLAEKRALFEWSEFVTEVLGVALSPDQKTLAAGSLDGSLRFFDAVTGKEKLAPKGLQTRVTVLGLSKDAAKMLTGTYDGEVVQWDIKGRKRVCKHGEHQHYVIEAGYNAAGQPYSIGQELKLVYFDARSGKVARTVELESAAPNLMGVAVSPDGALMVTSHYVETEDAVSGKQVLWDLVTGEVKATFATEAVFNAYALADDGKRMAVLQQDRLALWTLGATAADVEFEPQEMGYYGMALLGADAAVTGDIDGKVMLWRKGAAGPSKTAVVSADEHVVMDLAVAADGERVFVAVEGAIVVLDAELNELVRITAFEGLPLSLAASGDGSVLLSGMSDSTVLVWAVDKLVR